MTVLECHGLGVRSHRREAQWQCSKGVQYCGQHASRSSIVNGSHRLVFNISDARQQHCAGNRCLVWSQCRGYGHHRGLQNVKSGI